jgi:septation ring formation regulator EzrA
VQERAGNTLELLGIHNNFLNRTAVAQQRIDKGDYMKLKYLRTTKEMITRLKSQRTERRKTFACYTSDKGIITRMYRELKKLNSTKESVTDEEMGE